MDIVRYRLHADPFHDERLGVLLDAGNTVADLQAAHMSMRGTPSPLLRDLEHFQQGGDAARALTEAVAAWVESQRPPGTTVPSAAASLVGGA